MAYGQTGYRYSMGNAALPGCSSAEQSTQPGSVLLWSGAGCVCGRENAEVVEEWVLLAPA